MSLLDYLHSTDRAAIVTGTPSSRGVDAAIGMDEMMRVSCWYAVPTVLRRGISLNFGHRCNVVTGHDAHSSTAGGRGRSHGNVRRMWWG
jgi:hypothetical protein